MFGQEVFMGRSGRASAGPKMVEGKQGIQHWAGYTTLL